MIKSLFHVIGLMVIFLLLATITSAEIPKYKHTHLNSFPVQDACKDGKITIDGDLSEWKPDTFIDMYADPDLKEFFSCKVATSYDTNGLLLAVKYVDASPMINRVDPTVDPFRGWAGDGLQFRLITDATMKNPITADKINSEAIVHCTMWYFTDKAQPTLDLRYGMDFHGVTTLIGEKSGLTFKKCDGGYALEGRIPWSVLKATAPKPGDKWTATLQPLWGNADGSLQHNFFEVVSAGGFHFQRTDGWGTVNFIAPSDVKATLSAQATDEIRIFETNKVNTVFNIPVKYTNPTTGFVSLAICQSDGQIVRTLLTKVQRSAGIQTETWDGKDDNGKPVPPGQYTMKALTHPGITPKYISSVMNSGNPGWGNSGGKFGWGGDHANPIDAVSDDKGNTYLMWTFNEGGDFLIKVDATGQKQWGSRISWGDFDGGATALVYDNEMIYVAKDGKNRKGANHGGLFVFNATNGNRMNFISGQGVMPITDWNTTSWPTKPVGAAAIHEANITGLTTSPDYLFASLYIENKIVALDKKTMKVVNTYIVQNPGNVKYDAVNNRLFAISGEQIVTINIKDGTVKPFISEGLKQPYGMALDAGILWVSVGGKQMQVLGYDAQGKLVKSIGKKGGRPLMGKFDPDGILNPCGISVDTKGQLWVTEHDSTPKRISLWNVKNCKLIKDFYGSAAYAPMMAPNLDKPEEVLIHDTKFLVDYTKGTWRPLTTVYRQSAMDGPAIGGSEMGYGFMGATFHQTTIAGKPFAFNGHGGVFAVKDDKYVPVYSIGNYQKAFPALNAAKQEWPWNTSYEWKDQNGDGLIQEGESRKISGVGLGNAIAQFGGTMHPGGGFIQGNRIFRPNGLDEKGIPNYPKPEDAEKIITGTGPMTKYSNWMDVWPSYKDDWKKFYAVASLRNPVNGGMDGGGEDGIYKFDRDGKIDWRYSRVAVFYALKAPLAKTGDLYGALRIAGFAEMPKQNGGQIVGVGVYRGYFGFLSEDGLFIDQVGYDNGRGPAPNFDVFFIENFSGYFFKHPKTGKVYLFCGDVDGRILELQGWDKIRTFDAGKLSISDDDFKAVIASATTDNGQQTAPPLSVIKNTPALDPTLKGWDLKKLGTITIDETTKAQVGLAYDDKNLYAIFKVQDSTPWKNVTTDWHFPFKGGDGVDIHLGIVNPKPEGKRVVQPGDVRVIITPGDKGALNAVAMWGKVPAGMAKAPMLYKSPVAEEPFERVIQLTTVTGTVQVEANSYLAQVAIPWADLGMSAPVKNAQLQGDLGILLSDGSGTKTTLRRYLYNQDTGVTNDIPSEVRVVSANWGTIIFE
jgi:hypothetical protein